MAMTRTYLSIDGQILSEMRAGETRARDYVLDPLGNVMGVYQADWPVAYMSFDPWGEVLSSWNGDSYKFAWVGGWGYRRTGLEVASHYVRARHYSFLNGSWTTVDPLWPGERAYGYVGGRVLAVSDPSGKTVKLCKGDIVGQVITHWFLAIDGKYCKSRIDYSFNGILINRQYWDPVTGTWVPVSDPPPKPKEDPVDPKYLPPTSLPSPKDRCIELRVSASVEKCLCDMINEFRSGPNNEVFGGQKWVPEILPRPDL